MMWNKRFFATRIKTWSNRQSTTTLYPPSKFRHLSTNKSPPTRSATLWQNLKAPAIFGVGLYFGMMFFGKQHETKQGSAYLNGLSSKFWSGFNDGKEEDSNDEKDEK